MTYNPDEFPRPTIHDAKEAHESLEKIRVKEHDEDGTLNLDYVEPDDLPEVERATKTLKRYGIDDNNGHILTKNVRNMQNIGIPVSDISGQSSSEDIHPDEHSGLEFEVNGRKVTVEEVKLD